MMSLTARQIFLLDAIGAVYSALMLGVVLRIFESHIGMPRVVLYPLALAACCLAVYSFSCYRFVKARPHIFLKIIAGLNTLYCCVSMVLLFQYWPQLSALGVAYFVLEKIIVLALAAFEWRSAIKLAQGQ